MIEGIVAFAVLAAVVAASWVFRRKLALYFALLRDASVSIFVLLLTVALYGAAQVREVLWADYHTAFAALQPETETWFTSKTLFLQLLWQTLGNPATISILVMAFCLAAINPDAIRIHNRGIEAVNNGWLIRAATPVLFLGIVFYNILAAHDFELAYSSELGVFVINVALVALPVLMVFGLLDGLTAAPPSSAKTVSDDLQEQDRAPLWALPLSAAFIAPFVVALVVALVFVSLALVHLVFAAPLKLMGLDLGPYVGNVIVMVNLLLGGLMGLFFALRQVTTWLAGDGSESSAQQAWPIVGMLALTGLTLSVLNLNDTHKINALRDTCPDRRTPAFGIDDAYKQWIDARVGQWHPTSPAPYPIYVVSAEGGGIYAAYHAALTLSAIEDRLPGFSRHVFAISSVSGGSLGAGVFASLLAAEPQAPSADWHWERSREILSNDFLSPLAYAALFTDPPALLLPCVDGFCPGRKLDRARALEESFDRAWRSSIKTSPQADLFKRSATAWNPAGNVPALLLNTTEVESGMRVTIAPFSLKGVSASLVSLAERAPCLDVSLATATALSARFPFLTPSGWYEVNASPPEQTFAVRDPKWKPLPTNATANIGSDKPTVGSTDPKATIDAGAKAELLRQLPSSSDLLNAGRPEKKVPAEPEIVRRRLVDGAYFDNSGIMTAADVIAHLQRTEQQLPGKGSRQVRFILIVIKTITGRPTAGAPSLAEFLAPLRTMDSVRAGRAEAALKDAAALLDGAQCAADYQQCPGAGTPTSACKADPLQCASPALRVAPLAAPDGLPLGWLLSAETRKSIEDNDLITCEASPSTPLSGLLRPELTGFDARAHKCALLGHIHGETMLPLRKLGAAQH